MSLSSFALRNKPIITTGVAILIAAGFLVYNTISRREDPEYVVRTCLVMTKWPGTPVTEVDGRTIGNGEVPGPMTGHLRGLYEAAVEADVAR